VRSSSEADLTRLVERLVGVPVTSLELLHRGGNSRVRLARFGDSAGVVVKEYHRHPGDPRDRFGVELRALDFLRTAGFRDVPAVLGRDADAAVAVLEHVPGDPFPPERVTEADLDTAVAFVARLAECRTRPDAAGLPPASDATFSQEALCASVASRLERFEGPSRRHPELAAFLAEFVVPTIGGAAAPADDRELPVALRTLSPSDFGFHNALRHPGGRLTFLDFEYFGWDDPAKLICDFVLHPAMDLDAAASRRFAEGVLAVFDDPALPERVERSFPLYAAKWALILLNEFVPAAAERRRFAGRPEPDAEVLAQQLAKARRVIEQVHNRHGIAGDDV
jgi:hypothetical protein